MKNQMMLVGAVLALSGCSWVDKTGSQNTTPELLSDDGAVLLTERDVYDRTISIQQSVQANFSLIAEGSGPAASCGEFLLPTDSAATLEDACDPSLDYETECKLNFTIKTGASSTYTATIPKLRQSVALSYAIQSEDINGNLNDTEATLCLKAVNDAPEAADHNYQVEYRGTLETSDADFDFNCALISGSGVLKGASDDFDFASVDLNTTACLTANLVEQPGQAIAFSLNPLGGFTYSPSPALGPGSSDTFKYMVSDGSLESASKTVTITVIGDNDAPVILAIDTLIVDENTPKSIAVTALAEDPEGEALNVSEISAPAHGSTTQSADSTELTYTPETDYVGEDSFNFTVQDIAGASSQGQVNVLVIKANEAPSIAAPSRLSYDFNDSAPETERFSVTLADRETALNQLQLSARSSNNNIATVGSPTAISGNGEAVFVINPVANGRTILTLTVTDRGLTDPAVRPSKSATATVVVDIRGINTNRAPVARDSRLDIPQGNTRTLNLNSLTSDPEGDNLSYSLINPPAGVTLSGSNLRIANTATQTLRSFSVVYQVSDGDKTDRGTVSITITAAPNNAPVAGNGNATVQAGGTASVNLNTLASDADGDSLTYTLVNPPAGASLSGNTLRVVTTTASSGTIRVTYRASDDEDSDTGVFAVTITAAPNNAPVAGNGSASVQAGGTASVNLNTLASDADGDALTYTLVNAPSGATLTGNTLRVATATTAASGAIRVTYRASDDEDSDTGVFTVNVTALPNNAPVTRDVTRSITAGQSTSLDLAAISSDADGDTLRYSLDDQTTGVTLSGSNIIVSTLASAATQTITVDFTVSDDEDEASGTLTVNVTAVVTNSAPVAGTGSFTVEQGASNSIDLLDIASDSDPSDTLVFSLINAPAQASLSGSVLTYTSEATDAPGPVSIGYSVTDGSVASGSTVTVTITTTTAGG